MNFDSRDLALTAVFTALYVVINILESVFSGSPVITYGPIQLRIADALIPLAALFGWSAVGGVTVGCFITNAYFFVNPTDVILGPIANLVAACLILFLRRRRLLACIIGALPIGLIVGSYLWLFIPTTEILGLPVWLASIISITISSLITVGVLGYILLSILSRPNVVGPLKSRGLKVLDQK